MPRNFEDWVAAYMVYTQHSEAPDAMHFWTAISTVAGALRRHVWIDMGYFQWVPNFYIILVAPPGIVSKSTTASIGMRLLHQVEGINFGPEALSWQRLVQALAEACEGFEDPTAQEFTVQRMSAITISAGELGTLLNPQDREMVDAFVSLWDGQKQEWKKSTKTQGDDTIKNPWINVVACTTPAWIAGAFPEYMVSGGFTSRTIFVFADKKRKLVAYPGDHLPPDFLEMEQALVEDLQEIATQVIGPMILTPGAKEWGENWYTKHYAKKPLHLDNDRFGGYLARKQTHLHKLAMVLSAARRSDRVITSEILSAANDILTDNEVDLPKVFGNIGNSKEGLMAHDLYQHVLKSGRVKQSDLFKYAIRYMNYTQFEMALRGGVQAGIIKAVQDQGITWYCAPGKEWE